ncbi:MAG: RadC family protein [Thermoanaerobaculia bacterium]
MTDVICDLPIDDRPRERLLRHGAQTLSNSELIAILLGSGVPGMNAIQLARTLLDEGISGIQKRDHQYLQEVSGIGPAKAARVLAAFELGRRAKEIVEVPPREVYDHSILGPQLIRDIGHHAQERLGAAFLDSRHAIITQREIYIGTINNALVSTRDIIRHALVDHFASAVVIYHNHPSGDPSPSEEDIRFTKKLKFSLGTCDIELVDHLIVGEYRYTSMATRGMLQKE